MTDEQTSVLESRRNRPADDTAPAPRTTGTEPADEQGLRWRGPVALLAVASAIAALVVWIFGGNDPATTERAATDVTRPAATAPVTTESAPTTAADTTAPAPAPAPDAPAATGTAAPSTPAAATTSLPAGWEPRTFQGVTFAVPPGATQPDLVDPGTADAPALFSWTGPSLGGEVYSHVSMWIYSAGGAPTLGPEYQPITVPGADQAHCGPVPPAATRRRSPSTCTSWRAPGTSTSSPPSPPVRRASRRCGTSSPR